VRLTLEPACVHVYSTISGMLLAGHRTPQLSATVPASSCMKKLRLKDSASVTFKERHVSNCQELDTVDDTGTGSFNLSVAF